MILITLNESHLMSLFQIPIMLIHIGPEKNRPPSYSQKIRKFRDWDFPTIPQLVGEFHHSISLKLGCPKIWWWWVGESSFVHSFSTKIFKVPFNGYPMVFYFYLFFRHSHIYNPITGRINGDFHQDHPRLFEILWVAGDLYLLPTRWCPPRLLYWFAYVSKTS